MPAVFDHCPACGRATTLPADARGDSIAVYRTCAYCKSWRWVLFIAFVAFFVLSLVLVVYALSLPTKRAAGVSAFGISLTLIGGYLLFGRLEVLLLIAKTLGGFSLPQYASELKKHTQCARVGLLLVLLGLFCQAVSATMLQ